MKKFRAEVEDLLGRCLVKVLTGVIPRSGKRKPSSRKAEEWNSVNNGVFFFFNSHHLFRANYVTSHIFHLILTRML